MNLSLDKKRINVLLTLNNSHISGIENYVLKLIKNSDRNLFEFTVAIPCNGQIVNVLKQYGTKYYIFNDNCKKPHNFMGIVNLLKIIANNNYDIIHAQAGILPCLLGFLFGIKMRLEHKHGLDFTEEKRENLGWIRIFYESIKKYFVNYTITVCERDRLFLINKFGYDTKKVVTVYNGVDDLSLSANKIKKEFITIGTVCRLTYQKAPEHFVEIAKLIENEGIIKDIRYEIWGTGELQKTLENLIKLYNLENKVILMGYMNDKKMTMSNLDIFVLTSRYEGIPYVILEAMSAKLPIVSTDVGGTSEIITSGKNGILIPRGEIKSMANSIIELINDEELRRRLKDAAYEDFKQNWTIERTIPRIQQIYLLNK